MRLNLRPSAENSSFVAPCVRIWLRLVPGTTVIPYPNDGAADASTPTAYAIRNRDSSKVQVQTRRHDAIPKNCKSEAVFANFRRLPTKEWATVPEDWNTFSIAKNYTINSNRLSPIATHCHFTKSRKSCYRAYPSATQTKHTRINNKKIKGGTTTKMRLQSWSLFGLTNEFSLQVEKALDIGIHVRRQVDEAMNKNEQKWHTEESNPWTKRLADALARRFTLSQNGYGT